MRGGPFMTLRGSGPIERVWLADGPLQGLRRHVRANEREAVFQEPEGGRRFRYYRAHDDVWRFKAPPCRECGRELGRHRQSCSRFAEAAT